MTQALTDAVAVEVSQPVASATRTKVIDLDQARGGGRHVAILGLGYVGLPTALAFHAAGSKVTGIDVSPERRERIERREVDLLASDHDRLQGALSSDRFVVTGNAAKLRDADVVVVCVPTPIDDYLMPDLTILKAACETVVNHAVPGQTLLLTSTTYVGCTRELIVTPLARRGFAVGTDIFVAFCPERIDPGNCSHVQEVIPRVVGGATSACAERAMAVLKRYVQQIHIVPSCEAAELTKLFENTFRAVNIVLANEIADVAGVFGLDIIDVLDAAATKPYGFMPFSPGPGVGGHCIPCDPHYLLWQLRSHRLQTPLIERAMTSIALRPRRVVERAREALSNMSLGLPGARILVLGVSYKANVADVRESPALQIVEELVQAGSDVSYSDPFIPDLRILRGEGSLRHVERPELQSWDLVILHTRHSCVDEAWLVDGPLVLDATYRAHHLNNRIAL